MGVACQAGCELRWELCRREHTLLEKQVKEKLEEKGQKDRGSEWFKVPIAELLSFLRLKEDCPDPDDDIPLAERYARKIGF